MKKFTKIMAIVLALALTAALSAGLTLAYLTDRDADVNVMTLGNVSIKQHEYERAMNADGTYKTYTVTSRDNAIGYELTEFKQAKPLYPAVLSGNDITWDDTKVYFDQLNDGSTKGFQAPFAGLENVQDKFVFVENTGKSDAYVRTLIAYEVGEDTDAFGTLIMINFNQYWTKQDVGVVNIDDNNYFVVEYVYGNNSKHPGGAVKPGEFTYNSLAQVYLKSVATNEDVEAIDGNDNGTYDILVLSQAVQVEGFDSPEEALNAGFGVVNADNAAKWFGGIAVPTLASDAEALAEALEKGEDVILNKDIEDAAVKTVGPYGDSWYGMAQNGGVFDGNGNTLDFEMGPRNSKNKYDNYGIMTSGGTIKNVTVTGVFRGIMVMNPTEDIFIDNITVGDEEMCYAINTGEGNGEHSMVVTNSVIKGWSSYGTAIKDLSFKDCTFVQGEYYTDVYGRLVKPYVNTVFENCEFGSKFYIDLSQLGKDGDGHVLDPDAKIELVNCTVNGVKLTADNWMDLIASESDCGDGQISIEGKDGNYMTSTNIFDYVTIK